MSGPAFTLPPQILDMLAKGLREMDSRPPSAILLSGEDEAHAVWMQTDSGDVLTFIRRPDMEES